MRNVVRVVLLSLFIFLTSFTPVFASSVCPITEPGASICRASYQDPYLIETIIGLFSAVLVIVVIGGVVFLLRRLHWDHLTNVPSYDTMYLMPNPELEKYIKSARDQKIPDDEIKRQLVSVGWSQSFVESAVGPKPPHPLEIPRPPLIQADTWIVFEHIVFFIALYASAVSLKGILDHIVDTFLVDSVSTTYQWGYAGYYPSSNDVSLRWNVAALIVSFPIFGYLYLQLQKQVLENSLIKHLSARKFFVYFTLIGTLLVVCWNAIFTIYDFLNGTLAWRSFGHFIVILLIGGSLFWYFFKEAKKERKLHGEGA